MHQQVDIRVLRNIWIVTATERWLGLLGVGVRVREGSMRVEISVHSLVIAYWARYREGRWVRVVCGKDAKDGSVEGLMSPMYALMRCVDNALIDQRGW